MRSPTLNYVWVNTYQRNWRIVVATSTQMNRMDVVHLALQHTEGCCTTRCATRCTDDPTPWARTCVHKLIPGMVFAAKTCHCFLSLYTSCKEYLQHQSRAPKTALLTLTVVTLGVSSGAALLLSLPAHGSPSIPISHRPTRNSIGILACYGAHASRSMLS
jgi:hypothetical protein